LNWLESATIGERKPAKTVGVAAAPKKKYLVTMNNFKNLLIAILTGLLALTLFTQPAQSAGKSKEAKAIEYAQCLVLQTVGQEQPPTRVLDTLIAVCNKYQP
jgi:hypothetical protein